MHECVLHRYPLLAGMDHRVRWGRNDERRADDPADEIPNRLERNRQGRQRNDEENGQGVEADDLMEADGPGGTWEPPVECRRGFHALPTPRPPEDEATQQEQNEKNGIAGSGNLPPIAHESEAVQPIEEAEEPPVLILRSENCCSAGLDIDQVIVR